MIKLPKPLEKVKDVITKTLEVVFLSLSYVTGIGLTSLVAKLAGKHFLPFSKQSSSFTSHQPSTNARKMY